VNNMKINPSLIQKLSWIFGKCFLQNMKFMINHLGLSSRKHHYKKTLITTHYGCKFIVMCHKLNHACWILSIFHTWLNENLMKCFKLMTNYNKILNVSIFKSVIISHVSTWHCHRYIKKLRCYIIIWTILVMQCNIEWLYNVCNNIFSRIHIIVI
jgi:hypothetical protein